jgi:hypothetical protein
VKTFDAWLPGLGGVSAIAILAVGLAWLGPVGQARAQGDVNKDSGPEKRREALEAELRKIQQEIKKKQAELEEIKHLAESLPKKQADLQRTLTDLKKRAAKVADALANLEREKTPSPFVFPAPNPPLQHPILIFPPPKPAPCPPPPWVDPGPGSVRIYPLGTPGGPMSTPLMPQR